MTTIRIGRWLLVAIAVVGIAFVVSATTLSMTAPVPADAHPVTMDADEWATWMDSHMTGHMGPGSLAWMESHMGATVDQMGQYMAGSGPRSAGMYGQGYGC